MIKEFYICDNPACKKDHKETDDCVVIRVDGDLDIFNETSPEVVYSNDSELHFCNRACALNWLRQILTPKEEGKPHAKAGS